MANYRRAQSKQSSRVATLVVLLLLVVVGMIVLGAALLAPEPSSQVILETEHSEPAVQQGPLPGLEMEREGEHAREEFHYLLNAAPVFDQKGEKGSVYLENCEGNTGYMQVEYRLEENGEMVYTSPLLPPACHLQTDVLDQGLDLGEYRATAYIYVYDSAEAEQEIGCFKEDIQIKVV